MDNVSMIARLALNQVDQDKRIAQLEKALERLFALEEKILRIELEQARTTYAINLQRQESNVEHEKNLRCSKGKKSLLRNDQRRKTKGR